MWFCKIRALVLVINTRNAIRSVAGWEDSNVMLDIVSHCNDFIEACKVDEETNKLALGEFERRLWAAYNWLDKEGAFE